MTAFIHACPEKIPVMVPLSAEVCLDPAEPLKLRGCSFETACAQNRGYTASCPTQTTRAEDVWLLPKPGHPSKRHAKYGSMLQSFLCGPCLACSAEKRVDCQEC